MLDEKIENNSELVNKKSEETLETQKAQHFLGSKLPLGQQISVRKGMEIFELRLNHGS